MGRSDLRRQSSSPPCGSSPGHATGASTRGIPSGRGWLFRALDGLRLFIFVAISQAEHRARCNGCSKRRLTGQGCVGLKGCCVVELSVLKWGKPWTNWNVLVTSVHQEASEARAQRWLLQDSSC